MPLLALDLEPRPVSAPRSAGGPPIRLRVRFDNLGRGLFPLQGTFRFARVAWIVALLLVPGADASRRSLSRPPTQWHNRPRRLATQGK